MLGKLRQNGSRLRSSVSGKLPVNDSDGLRSFRAVPDAFQSKHCIESVVERFLFLKRSAAVKEFSSTCEIYPVCVLSGRSTVCPNDRHKPSAWQSLLTSFLPVLH
jgi:hypothetical protein